MAHRYILHPPAERRLCGPGSSCARGEGTAARVQRAARPGGRTGERTGPPGGEEVHGGSGRSNHSKQRGEWGRTAGTQRGHRAGTEGTQSGKQGVEEPLTLSRSVRKQRGNGRSDRGRLCCCCCGCRE
ncbi:hypothetical protein PBY51_018346 [Eleginops maclovinus]|uniref:Uncharacterized protein n=1 Tax=Eleginops maclovinus TaxID=56733 RepID=A0AAN7Y9D3_ELEMC|nr:hypothetical protein PBY51_018346 [Eleginops maclovinus]